MEENFELLNEMNFAWLESSNVNVEEVGDLIMDSIQDISMRTSGEISDNIDLKGLCCNVLRPYLM